MTPERFREIRENDLRLHGDDLAATLRLSDGRTIRRYEAGDRKIPGPVAILMELMAESPSVRRRLIRSAESAQDA